MDSTQLLAKVRERAFIGDANAYPQYSDQNLLDEMSQRLRSDFPLYAVEARAGYLLKTTTVAVAASVNRVRVPSRAFMNGLYTVECQDTSGKYYPLDESAPEDQWLFEQQTNATLPRKYMFSGGHINLLPTPTTAVTLRLRYYLRPSQLTTAQNSKNGTDRGRVTAVSGFTATVNALPLDMQAAVPAAIVSGATLDVIQPSGWFEPVLTSQVGTLAGLVITFPVDVSNIVQIGDYVRAENQSDWPTLPEDYHELLANDAALWVLADLGLDDKSLEGKTGRLYTRFKDSLQPRTQQSGVRLPIKSFGSWRSR